MGIPLRILVVEDSEDDTLLLMRELRRAGFDTAHERVDRPETMSAALDRQPWDFVISDYSMPNFRGDAALKLLRERDQDLPFVFVSGTIGEEAAVDAMKVGANDYIIKGNRTRLVPVIQRELREADLRRKKKQAEQDLRESEARYRELFANATYGIYRSAGEERFLDGNPALLQMLGYSSQDEILGLDLARDVYVDAETHAHVLREVQANQFKDIEAQWKHKDGRIIIVRLSGRVARRVPGYPDEIEIIAEDITERRALQKQIGVLQKLDAIGRLAGGVAHDFNNVIGVIQGWTEVLLEEAPENSSQRRALEKILDHGRLACDLTRQLLAFARSQPIEPRVIDINHTVSGVLSLLERTIGKSITIKTTLEPRLHTTLADPTQVQQVLMNLCLNARDAMPHGVSVFITTENVPIDQASLGSDFDAVPGDYVLLKVSDSGTGMDISTLERIFEPFFTTKEVGKGTGLGLATVFGVVKQHNGFIRVESELGRGTTFRVYWPAVKGPVQPAAQTEAKVLVGGKETLLIAEDHEGLRELFQDL